MTRRRIKLRLKLKLRRKWWMKYRRNRNPVKYDRPNHPRGRWV